MKFSIEKTKKILSDNAGFSLIELVMAVAIVAIIASGFAAATVSSTKTNISNNERQKARGSAVTEIDSKIHPDKTYTSADGLDSATVRFYLDDSGVAFDSQECYVIKRDAYKAYVKKSD